VFLSLLGCVPCFGWFVELEEILGADVSGVVVAIIATVIAGRCTDRFDPFAHGILVVLVLIDNVKGGDPVLLEKLDPIGDSILGIVIVVGLALFCLLAVVVVAAVVLLLLVVVALMVIEKELDSHRDWYWLWR